MGRNLLRGVYIRIFPIIAMAVAVSMLVSGCGYLPGGQYSRTYLDVFDTVTTVTGTAQSQAQFQSEAAKIHDELVFYHRLFDIYNEYDGIVNLKTVNEYAATAPVKVDPAIIALLKDCKYYDSLTGGKVNVAMGSVLKLWHEARTAGLKDPENARLPDAQMLNHAAKHMDLDNVILDEVASTVYFADPELSLDVGAIAKGWAAQKVAQNAPKGLLINVGGNICATGPKKTDGTPWIIGIQDPDGGNKTLHTLRVTGGAVVTSGDYQRTYKVDGVSYHHIIDPQTLTSARYWRSVTVMCGDSALADALSTALFLMPLEEGKILAQRCGAEAFWVDASGQESMTSGFRDAISQ